MDHCSRGRMQIALGAVYAWSVFRIPLVTVAFELAILVLRFAAFADGLWMRRSGPRPVAFLAAVLYGLGTALAGTSHSLTNHALSQLWCDRRRRFGLGIYRSNRYLGTVVSG